MREDIIQNRIEKLEKLREAGMDPYPASTNRTHTLAQVSNHFSEIEASGEGAIVVGRVRSLRGQGNIAFVKLQDGTGEFQAVLMKNNMDVENYKLFSKTVDVGDFIEVTGTCFVTQAGQESLQVSSWKMLTKSLRPLPTEHFGLKDEEERYRKRYLDMILNPEVREMLERKSKFWNVTRNFLKERGFLEVETPTLEHTTGGAEARPFITHHNDFGMDVYLRISVGELWQKRLMAAGFEKTFEIGRVYRNEGSSPEHLQEFTNMEFYWAYVDYRDGMNLVHELYRTIAQEVYGTTQFTTRGHTFDLADEWREVDYLEEIKAQTGIDILHATDEEIRSRLDEFKVKYDGENRERLTDTLWKYCRRNISGPAFLVHVPKIVSPLAKEDSEQPGLTQRFQPILAGAEVGNGFSELNDPIDQRERFELQQELIDRGDDEAMMADEDFAEMLEHGMPPTCGFGFGERLFAFLEDRPVRECQTFPFMKPKEEETSPKKKEAKVAVVVINKDADMEPWQEMNTVAHLSASFAAREDGDLFMQDTVETSDNQKLPLNIQHAIMIKSASSNEDLHVLYAQAQEVGVQVVPFTREMLETTDDRKVEALTKEKGFDDVEFLGVLVFGPKKKVDEMTKDFELGK